RVPVAWSGTGTATPSEPLGISDCTPPPFGGRANEPSSCRNPRATRTRHAWRAMLPNEHAPEPVVPTPPPPAPARRARLPRLRGPATGLLIAVTFVAGVGVGRFEPMVGGLGAPAASPNAAAGPTDDGVDDFGLVREAWDLLHEKYVG